jgi:hypothetical protein
MLEDAETSNFVGQVGNSVLQSFFVLPKGGDVSQLQTDIFWEGELSPWPIITFWDLLLSDLENYEKLSINVH